jgi:branched-subunit amino acid aminotransferase/4-amino-4-deoxychorismate lyase
MENRMVYLNGAIVPLEQAAISPLDIGLLRGYAVFDLLRTAGGRPFLLAEHLRRLRSSAEVLDLKVPVDDDAIAAAIDELLALNDHGEESVVRLVVTGGVSPDGMAFDPEQPTFLILTHDFHEPPAELYATGGILLTEEHHREAPEAKTTNYLTMLRNKPRTAAVGALDVLYHVGGRVSEAASASFYIVRDGVIHAPADRVLWGTVGSLVLDRASDTRSVVREGFTLEDVASADEAFLTSTTRGVMPIVRVDDVAIGDGAVGPVTHELMAHYAAAVAQAAGRS